MEETVAIIVGAGTSGLAGAASLALNSIPYIIIEREDCFASLWQKYAYERLHLHLKKEVCELPHMHYPETYPTYVPKALFIQYLENYVSHFNIRPKYNRNVELARFDEETKRWCVRVRNVVSGEEEVYFCRFLIVASGLSCDPFVPGDDSVEGLNSFSGEKFHSTMYRNGKGYNGKSVLVVGCGNSGMEIALDLANHGAITSIVVRSPMHILSRWMSNVLAFALRYVRREWADELMVFLSKVVYGDLSKYGITRPTKGPLYLKTFHNKFPVLDVGTVQMIKSGKIQVLPAIEKIRGSEVWFVDGKSHSFDAIVLCTGFTRSTKVWLQGDGLLNEDGFAKPANWKGKNGLYCIGLSQKGFLGASSDAQNVAKDIKLLIN